jgi:AAA family ATP:ADP antiporter
MRNPGSEEIVQTGQKPPGLAYKFLRLFTVIHPGEALTALLLALNIFLVILSYSILKPLRSGLFLAKYSAETQAYLAGIMAFAFIFFNKMFSHLASKVPRQKLIAFVTLFFISNLVVFYLLDLVGTPLSTIGPIYFVWLGIFNYMVIAQFWAFANDLYTEEAGKRLFPMIMLGQNIGASVGSAVAYFFLDIVGLYPLMLLAGAVLGTCIVLTIVIHNREIKKPAPKQEEVNTEDEAIKEEEKPLKKGGAFRLVFKSRYLLYIAMLILVLNLVNTTGEYMRNNIFKREAVRTVQVDPANEDEYEDALAKSISKLDSGFHTLVNVLAILMQLFLVSRIFKWLGVRGAIFILPLVAFGGYVFLAFGASLLVVRWAKALENSTDYSLMNTCRGALFLVTSREEKYKAKVVIDTFFVRTGDLLTGLFVYLGTTYLAFNVERFAMFNVCVVIIWIILAILIFKEHKKLSAKRKEHIEYMETG